MIFGQLLRHCFIPTIGGDSIALPSLA